MKFGHKFPYIFLFIFFVVVVLHIVIPLNTLIFTLQFNFKFLQNPIIHNLQFSYLNNHFTSISLLLLLITISVICALVTSINEYNRLHKMNDDELHQSEVKNVHSLGNVNIMYDQQAKNAIKLNVVKYELARSMWESIISVELFYSVLKMW